MKIFIVIMFLQFDMHTYLGIDVHVEESQIDDEKESQNRKRLIGLR